MLAAARLTLPLVAVQLLATAPLACRSAVPDAADDGDDGDEGGAAMDAGVDTSDGGITPHVLALFRDRAEVGGEGVRFAQTEAGSTRDMQLEIKNADDVSITILSLPPLLLVGPQAVAFVVAAQPEDVQLSPGESTMFTLRYRPTTAGDHRVTILLATGTSAQQRTRFPASGTASAPPTVPGVVAERYRASAGTTFASMPEFATLRPVTRAIQADFSIAADAGTNDFAYRFHGIVTVPSAGSWTFFTTSDDGSRLFLDDELVVENSFQQAPQERSGARMLSAGHHAIEVQYFDRDGGEELFVHWQPPSGKKTLLDPAALSTPPIEEDLEGALEGVVEGAAEGIVEGAAEGGLEGAAEGTL